MKKGEAVLIILIVVVLILILAPTGLMIKNYADFGNIEGTIINKEYHESYTSITYVMCGKILMPITTYHSETWNFELKKDIDIMDNSIKRNI